MLVRELLQVSAGRLARAGVDTPAIDAEILLGYYLGKSRTALFLAANEEISSSSIVQFRELLSRREEREPLAYIIGTQEFWSLDFLVNPHVLIPRPETELLLEKVITFYRKTPRSDGLILDLCCGSGAIAVVLAKELGRPILAIDISMEALSVARKNCIRHDVSHLVSFLRTDLLSAILPKPHFSYVVSNPPYVSHESFRQGLQVEVEKYEPHLALDGGEKGLKIIKQIRDQLLSRLLPGGHLFMEIGTEQGAEVSNMFEAKKAEKQSFSDVLVQKDYSGHDRIFYTKMKH